MTPNQRHSGEDQALLEQRRQVYERARNAHPHQWSGEPRDWAHIKEVHLNPDKPTHKEHQPTQRVA